MSRSDSHSSVMATQLVNAAVGVAVKRKMAEAPSIDNRRALEFSIGKRLQGTYGAELRRLAGLEPNLSPTELAQAVIYPAEYPSDDAPDITAYSGDRDRARRARHDVEPKNDPTFGFDPDVKLADVPGWSDGLALAKASVSEPARCGPHQPDRVEDPALNAEIDKARAAVKAGAALGATARAQRLDAARAAKSPR